MRRAIRAIRAGGVLIGALVALYLFFLLPASVLFEVLERSTGIALDLRYERAAAFLGAIVTALPYTVGYVRTGRSLERLWTFVIVAHLSTYVVFLPYFHFVTPTSVAYHEAGYVLFAVALSLAYVLVYRSGSLTGRQWVTT